MSTHRKAFTLVELLVVVTIIVILVALLLPSMEQAMAVAQRAKCMSNTRSWTMGMKTYSLDNKGAALWWAWDAQNFWPRRLAQYMGQPSFATPSGGDDGPLMANLCPSTILAAGGSMTTTWSAWGTQGSYGLNNFTNAYASNNFADQRYFIKYDRVPGDVPFIGDNIWVDAWPDGRDPPPTANPPVGENNSSMSRFCMNRHLKTVNLGYADCHAESVRPGDLWLQNWNAENQRTSNYAGNYFK